MDYLKIEIESVSTPDIKSLPAYCECGNSDPSKFEWRFRYAVADEEGIYHSSDNGYGWECASCKKFTPSETD